ncbi:MAG: metallophosphoesterase [Oscillospiraceae bacterium]|jgi:predicted MPP superfamily phosphohydrolase|nr:metallophosphoesterase [Oscillospiraceae bacterium]
MTVPAFLGGAALRLAGFLMSLLLAWNVPPPSGAPIEPVDEANLRLQFSVAADTHIVSWFSPYNPWDDLRWYGDYARLAKDLRDMGSARPRQDALVLMGDNTRGGSFADYAALYGILSRYNRAKNTLLVMGNHDLETGKRDSSCVVDRHNFFLRAYTGIATGKPYYSKTINGYTFIALGDEATYWDWTESRPCLISDAQLNWLDETMRAAEAGKPIFVFLHQPIDDNTYVERAGELRAVLEKYPNVFFFNGHLHTSPEVRQANSVTYVNVPSLTHPDEGTDVGFQVEAYDGRVALRARNYREGEWLAGHAYSIEV